MSAASVSLASGAVTFDSKCKHGIKCNILSLCVLKAPGAKLHRCCCQIWKNAKWRKPVGCVQQIIMTGTYVRGNVKKHSGFDTEAKTLVEKGQTVFCLLETQTPAVACPEQQTSA